MCRFDWTVNLPSTLNFTGCWNTGPSEGEGMEFAVLAAHINLRRQHADECFINIPAHGVLAEDKRRSRSR